MDALGNVNSVLVVGQQEMLEDGAVLEVLEEDTSFAVEEAYGGNLGKGDFEQTLEVSLNDTPADIDVLHSQVSIHFVHVTNFGFTNFGTVCTPNISGERFFWDMSRYLQ